MPFAPPFILPTVDSEMSAKAKLAKLKGETIKSGQNKNENKEKAAENNRNVSLVNKQ